MLENGKQAKLEQYQCERCGRFFYIDVNDKSDLDFGEYHCPYGCNEGTNHVRDIAVLVERSDLV